MSEKIDFSIRGPIKTSRAIKERSKDQNIRLKGFSSKSLAGVENQVNQTVLNLLNENSDWITQQRDKVKNILLGVDESEINKVFQNGLMIFFKQQYRLFTQHQKTHPKKAPDILQSTEYIHQQILAYTFDFVQSLKNSQKLGLTSIQALEIARMSYHYDPNILKQLILKYPDVDKGVIIGAALCYRPHPEIFIEDYITKVRDLTEKYPNLGINQWLIKFAALHHPSDPEKYIEEHKNDKIPE